LPDGLTPTFENTLVAMQRAGQMLDRARAVFANPSIWKRLQVAGMRQDFSWDRSAREYVKLYESTRKRRVGR